mgnify:FL=1
MHTVYPLCLVRLFKVLKNKLQCLQSLVEVNVVVSTKIYNEHQDQVDIFILSKTATLLSLSLALLNLGAYYVTKPGIYKQEPPHFSMIGRNEMPGDTTQKPGPGNYSPEKVWLHKQQAPGYSFGIRHTMYEAPLIVEVKE